MDECLELWLRVQPGPGKGSVVGRYGDRIKIRVAAPAVDGKANVALIRFLAREFGVKQGQIRLAGGARTPIYRSSGTSGSSSTARPSGRRGGQDRLPSGLARPNRP
jgi:uncharacterized protein